mmetsp:Transcript_25149/g.35237  ORF Transcript_25149/g.35237 Transcript_25149/m.35237 type:complete len:493 (+) Transcript_25149:71-1549(+)
MDNNNNPHNFSAPTYSSFFHLGGTTYKVPMRMHYENRQKLVKRMPKEGVILLQGGKSTIRYATDHEPLFRQESFFHYLFGVKEPDCYGAIDLQSRKSYLFVPRLPSEYGVWMGKIQPLSFFQELYEVDHAKYVDELDTVLKNELKASVLYLLKGLNTDSDKTHEPATFDNINTYAVDTELLFPEICECRVIKTPLELELMRYVNYVSSKAHIEVMKSIRPGLMEYQMESIFQHNTYFHGGCRHMSYTCICASGENSSVLHYGHAGAPNSKEIRDGEIVSFDMGAEYHCYGSDITRSFPVSGKFTEEQKQIYETVLAAQEAVIKSLKPGVNWLDMHTKAYEVICEKLKEHGLLQGDVDEMLKHDIPALFMPHGLGHLLGIDTHDVGGYPLGTERPTKPGYNKLRTVRDLEEGMVITVEPGVYFIKALLKKAKKDPLKSKFLNIPKLKEFKTFGGIRIEDDVVITAIGCENLTTAPKTVKEIEELMQAARSNKN